MINVVHTPTHTYINNIKDLGILRILDITLSYKNKAAQYNLKRFLKSADFNISRYGETWVTTKIAEIKKEIDCKCYEIQEDGQIKLLGGLWDSVKAILKANDVTIDSEKFQWEDISHKIIPWENIPPELRDWQKEAFDKFINAKDQRATIIAGTGSGKSLLALNFIKYFGTKTVFIVPTRQILDQTAQIFTKHLGKKYVGVFGGTKKETEKLVIVATVQSLTKLDPTNNPFINTELIIFDEADLMPAKTFEEVALNIFPKTWKRLSLTGTWMRNDGADMRLRGITFSPIYKYDSQEGIEDGILAKPNFVIVEYTAPKAHLDDRLLNIKENVMGCKPLNQFLVQLVNKFTNENKKVLILVALEEHGKALQQYINESVFVSSESGKGVDAAVKNLNSGEVKCIIATTVLGRGSDTKEVDVLINLLCTASEPLNKQAVGRALRVTSTKKTATIIDIRPTNNNLMKRHANVRIQKVYQGLGNVTYCKL